MNHVLLVEDEEESGRVVEASLKRLRKNIKVKWVKSAEEAERRIKKDPRYDLIIADHYLKGEETGFDLWKSCQKRHLGVPFLLTSALGPELFSVIGEGEPELPLFLHKPFRINECKELLDWFWEDETFTSAKLTANYQVVIAGLLLLLSIVMMTSWTRTSDSVSSTNDYVEPFKITIPTFKREIPVKHSRPTLIERILTAEFKRGVMIIELRANDILESFVPNANSNLQLVFPKETSSDGKFEKYGRLYRFS